jgi:hypothetical protein
MAAFLLAFDYAAGPGNPFPVVHVVPVALAAWYSGRWPAVTLAVTLPVAHIVFLIAVWRPPGPASTLVGITLLRGAVILVMALWFARLAEHERALNQHVQTLEGLLPICSFCKKIRNEAGEWERLERFISTRSDARFSHAFCPACIKEQYPELDESKAPKD